MTRLAEHFSPLFSAGLSLQRELAESAGIRQSCPEVYQQLGHLIHEAQDNARRDGKRDADIAETSFAIAAWLDEIIAAHPGWMGPTKPLQVTMFKTANAGNEFFKHLDALSSDQAEVREVYYMTLCLGFVGQYFLDASEAGKLAHIRDSEARQLPIQPAALHRLPEERITSQPYRLEDPSPPRIPSGWESWFLKGALITALLIPAGLFAYYNRPRVESKVETPPISAPVPDIRLEVTRILERSACAGQHVSIDSQNNVVLSGFVPTASDVQKIVESVKAVDGVGKVDSRLVPVEGHRSYCRVIEVIFPLASEVPEDERITLKPTSSSGRFAMGEQFALGIGGPSFDAYVYVDYYTIGGDVFHMMPNEWLARNFRKARESTTVQDCGPAGKRCKIQPPFGKELIVVVASKQPLMKGVRPPFEPAEVYIDALKTVLPAQAGPASEPAATANFVFIETHPAGS